MITVRAITAIMHAMAAIVCDIAATMSAMAANMCITTATVRTGDPCAPIPQCA